MPEYLTPGVYVEETSFRPKSLEGVSTSTTAFVGPTRRGPVSTGADDESLPPLLTSFADFERVYGGIEDLVLGGKPMINHVAHAVRAYFDNGGARLYVARVKLGGVPAEGKASENAADNAPRIVVKARSEGAAGDGEVVFRVEKTPVGKKALESARNGAHVLFEGKHWKKTGPDAWADADGGASRNSDGLAATAETVAAAEIAAAEAAKAQRVADLAFDAAAGDAEEVKEAVDVAKAKLAASTAVAESALAAKGTADQAASAARIEFDAAETARDATADGTPERDAAEVELATAQAVLTAAQAAAAAADAQNAEAEAARALAEAAFDTAEGDARDKVAAEEAAKQEARRKGDEAAAATKAAEATRAFLVTLRLDLPAAGREASETLEGIGLHPEHPVFLDKVLKETPGRESERLENSYSLVIHGGLVGKSLLGIVGPDGSDEPVRLKLGKGADGDLLSAATYKEGLETLARIEGISIVATPGAPALATGATLAAKVRTSQAIHNELITHVEQLRTYRIAVLDAPPDQTPGTARAYRGNFDSHKAAFYFPWVVVANPLARPGDLSQPAEIALPPSGYVCGIYARNDVQRGVFKAPANEIVRGALRFTPDINFRQQQILNPVGINCLRSLSGRGHRLWGARTMTSDPEFKYVNVRRYLLYLEETIDRGTQWAVFEPNGGRLWANIRETVSAFLYNEWRNGALLGGAKEAFFVRCDRSTMTQNDLDNGRLVCLIGVAIVQPAEFVIFRIGQKTVDARS